VPPAVKDSDSVLNSPEIKAVSKEERTKNNNFIVTLVVLRPKDSFGVLLVPSTGGGAKP